MSLKIKADWICWAQGMETSRCVRFLLRTVANILFARRFMPFPPVRSASSRRLLRFKI